MSAIHRSSKWITFTRMARPIIARTLPAPCVDPKPGCPGLVQPGQLWDIAHLVSHHRDPFQPLVLEAVGPAHRSCNRSQGGKEGRAKQIAHTRVDQRLPSEGSGW